MYIYIYTYILVLSSTPAVAPIPRCQSVGSLVSGVQRQRSQLHELHLDIGQMQRQVALM